MKIQVGDITLEADCMDDIRALQLLIPELRGVAQSVPTTSGKVSSLNGGQRFRRTKAEIEAGISQEEAFLNRAKNGSLKPSDYGMVFGDGDEINLEEPPL